MENEKNNMVKKKSVTLMLVTWIAGIFISDLAWAGKMDLGIWFPLIVIITGVFWTSLIGYFIGTRQGTVESTKDSFKLINENGKLNIRKTFNLVVAILIFILLFYSISMVDWKKTFSGSRPNSTVSCTTDAKICPDGSYVGRSGPNCEFVCPEIETTNDSMWAMFENLTDPKISFQYRSDYFATPDIKSYPEDESSGRIWIPALNNHDTGIRIMYKKNGLNSAEEYFEFLLSNNQLIRPYVAVGLTKIGNTHYYQVDSTHMGSSSTSLYYAKNGYSYNVGCFLDDERVCTDFISRINF